MDRDTTDNWFTCECSSSEHVFRVSYFPSDDPSDRELFVSVFLQEHGFLRRCWEATKYALGYKCRYGHWEEILLRREDVVRLIGLLEMARGSVVPEDGGEHGHDQEAEYQEEQRPRQAPA